MWPHFIVAYFICFWASILHPLMIWVTFCHKVSTYLRSVSQASFSIDRAFKAWSLVATINASVSRFKSPLATQSKERTALNLLMSLSSWPCKGILSLQSSSLPLTAYTDLSFWGFPSLDYLIILCTSGEPLCCW